MEEPENEQKKKTLEGKCVENDEFKVVVKII